MNSFYALLMSTFYIFNISQHKYLSFDATGQPQLSSVAQSMEFTEDSSTGKYQETHQSGWTFNTVDASKGIYTIGYNQPEANAVTFLYADIFGASPNGIGMTYTEPGTAFENGLWLITTQAIESEKITLKEDDTTFPIPTLDKPYLTIDLYRKFSAKEWNSFCIPFPLNAQQIKETWGEGTLVAELESFDGTRLKFNYCNDIKAGIPCIIYPIKTNADKKYQFDYISSTSWNGEKNPTFTINNMSYIGSYVPMTVNAGAYVFATGNNMYHLNRDNSMNGYRAYFIYTGTDAASKQLTWGFDGISTGIETTLGNATSPTPTDIYQMDGKLVKRKATTTQGLRPGVYIMNGMKVIVK